MSKIKKAKRKLLKASSILPIMPLFPNFLENCTQTEVDACRCNPDAENYNMNHSRRGIAVIFNHYICHGHSQPRRGTQCDVVRLNRILKKVLKFEVCLYEDLKHSEIMCILDQLSKQDYSQDDCFAVFVLTHGTLHGLTAKDTTYDVHDLWNFFLPNRCKSLKGKPKLFFINSCRGKKFDEGVVYEDPGTSVPETTGCPCTSYRVPTYADFLTFYSTMEGYTSLRHPTYGTWFIQSLCDVLEDKKYNKLELKEILTVTTRKTALKSNEFGEAVCQIPTMMSTLIRNVYFNKKPRGRRCR